MQNCPVDCVSSTWTSWLECSVSCGGQGTTSRAREIVVAPLADGQACPTTSETGQCGIALCPVDCSMSVWSSWSSCPVSCGTGFTARTRSVVQQPMNEGQLCGLTSESPSCATQFCPVDCAATAWTPWQTCSSLCSGTTRAPTVTSQTSCVKMCDRLARKGPEVLVDVVHMSQCMHACVRASPSRFHPHVLSNVIRLRFVTQLGPRRALSL